MYVVRGKAGTQRRYVTPGPQYSDFTLRSTWQWDYAADAWETRELGRKWKLLQNPHKAFAGSKVWALHAFQRSTPKIARVASRGTLLVDTGACCSVCTPEAFQTADLDPSATEELYTVDDTPLKACGEIRPKLRLGEQLQEEAQVTFQVVEGVNENILSVNRALDVGASVHFETDNCYIQWADGSIATFRREGRQFLLPYEELDGGKGQVKVAAINPEDEEAMAVHRHALQEDEEADAVREFAQQEADAAMQAEDPGLLADLEEAADEPEPPEPRGLPQPESPTEEQRQQHRLTHLPFAPWCEECVSGKSRQDQHKRDQSTERDQGISVVQMDYFFLSPEREEEVEDESRLVTILCLTDTGTGWPLTLQLPNKSVEVAQSKYCLQNIDLYFKNLRYDKIILQHDGEPAIRALANSIQRHVGASKVSVREAPPKQHQSQGTVESMNGFAASQIRTLWLDVRQRYPELDVSSNLTPWLVRHAAWLIARYHTRSRDGMTPYKLVTGGDYNHPVATLGEIVLGKVPSPKGKIQRRWIKGVWLGKLDRDDSNVLGTASGAIAVRSIRRLPKEGQISSELMAAMKGTPWQPRDGVRHKITRELSQPIAFPAPAASGSPEREEAADREHPTLAVDGHNVDHDALVVQAAAQLEEELEPMQDAEEFPDLAGGPADVSPVPTTPAESEIADPPPPEHGPSGSPPPFRGAGWSSNLQSLPNEPMSPSGLGAGGKRERANPGELKTGEADAKQPRQAGILQHLTTKEIWEKIQQWGNSEEPNNPTAIQRISNVTEFVDQMLDPEEVSKARKAQLRKLWERGAFTPIHRKDIPQGSQLFGHKWVDKCSRGTYKSRFTCADVKARYTQEQEAELDVFVPTPTPESHNVLEVYALMNKFYTRSLDIVAAFLIGRDRGAAQGKPVYVRAPIEWWDLFLEWLEEVNPADRQWYKDRFKEMCFRLDGNLYGRRTAGSVYRNELEEIVCSRVDPQRYAFVRGQKDPCIFRCTKTGIVLLHHVDDIRAAGPSEALAHLFEQELPRHCEVQAGELEKEGTAVEYLGRTKVRSEDAILTIPDEKHRQAVISAAGISARDRSEVPSKQLNLLETTPLSEEEAKRYRSAVGSAIYLSLDRRDIQYAVKEAARHMSQPRQCDMKAVKTLAAYLQTHPTVGRVVTCDPPSATGEWSIELYSDSDWAGCLESRRSTDCHVAVVCGAVVACTTQTQPGLPATSSPDAELRGVSRAAREALYLRDLITLDFGQLCGKPRLWTDSSSAMQAAKRIGPGAKLRHLEVCEFYVQGAIQSKQLALGKVKGTLNCANFLTKHPKSGTEVKQALPGLGMCEAHDGEDVLSSTKRISVKVSTVTKQHAWKTPVPASVAWIDNRKDRAGSTAPKTKGSVNYIKSLVILSQITAVRAQGQGNQWINPIVLYILALIGLLAIYVKLYQLGVLITDWLFPPEGENQLPEQPVQVEGAEVQLQLDSATVRLNITAYRDGRQLNISQTVNAPAAAPRQGSAEAPQPQPAETPRQEELTPSRIERWSEEQWVQRGAESNMTLQELIEWRRREERLIHGQDPDSSQDEPGESTSHSADSPASERDVPPEREEPPERVAPPERAEPPISSSGPELLTGDPAIEREAPLDPFDGMSPNELQQWREAENRVLGIEGGSSSGGSPFSGHS